MGGLSPTINKLMVHLNVILILTFFLTSGFYSEFIFDKPTRRVKQVFIHVSDSDWAHHDDISVITNWHVEENGWSDVGYHYFIKKNGEIQKGRDLERTPSSQKGHNHATISICLHGKEKFTKRQFESLRRLCKQIHESYYGRITFHGHKEVNSKKTCPNFDYVKVLNLDKDGYMKGI